MPQDVREPHQDRRRQAHPAQFVCQLEQIDLRTSGARLRSQVPCLVDAEVSLAPVGDVVDLGGFAPIHWLVPFDRGP